MKKRVSIGIVLLVIAFFLLFLSVAINVYLERAKDKNKSLSEEVSITNKVILDVQKSLQGDYYGES